jgi:hypothetical protein
MTICALCQRDRSTTHATFRTNTGFVLFRSAKAISGAMCFACARKQLHGTAAHNLFFSWWGIISFAVTPFFLALNALAYLRARSSGALTPAELAQGPSKVGAVALAVVAGLVGLLALLMGGGSMLGALSGSFLPALSFVMGTIELTVAGGLLLTSAALFALAADSARAG